MRQQILNSVTPLTRIGRRYVLDPAVRFAAGLTPISEHLESDVFIVGYPKSGNTWFQNLVSGVVYGINTLIAPDTLIQELVPDIHRKKYYKRFWSPMFFKSHLLPQPDYRHVVYLLRDGRDAMVSYFHFLTALQGREPNFAEMIRSGAGIYSKWHKHVDAWGSNPYGSEMLTVKYENLKDNPVNEMQRFCDFVEIDRDISWLKQVAYGTAFERMQEKEMSGRYHMDNEAWPEEKLFTRRGEVGSYKDEMPPEIQAIFLQEAQETLARCGYL